MRLCLLREQRDLFVSSAESERSLAGSSLFPSLTLAVSARHCPPPSREHNTHHSTRSSFCSTPRMTDLSSEFDKKTHLFDDSATTSSSLPPPVYQRDPSKPPPDYPNPGLIDPTVSFRSVVVQQLTAGVGMAERGREPGRRAHLPYSLSLVTDPLLPLLGHLFGRRPSFQPPSESGSKTSPLVSRFSDGA
jgi:hypothetical protein